MTISITKTVRISTVLAAFMLLVNATGVAQCKNEIKEGITKLSPYTHNGQVNNANIANGKPAEFHLSFYKGLKYKIQVVSDPALGAVQFKVYDENKNAVYDSNEDPENPGAWDFLSTSSQELSFEVVSADKSKKGCVAVLVGMKSAKVTSNPIRDL